MPGPARELHKIVMKRTCCCWSRSYKILLQEPPTSLPQELSYKHSSDMASASSSRKDLLGRISPGPPEDLQLRTCTGSCKDLLERNFAGSPQEFARAGICENLQCAADPELEDPAAQTLCEPAQLKCTWTCHKSENLREKCSAPRLRRFVRVCAVKTHMEMSQEQYFAREFTGSQMEHPDQAPAFTPAVRTPKCWRTIWGFTHHNADPNQ